MVKELNRSLYSANEKSKLNIFLNVLIVLIIAALIAEIAFSATYSGIYVVGASMNDTLQGAHEFEKDGMIIADTSGDYVYVDRHRRPTYGDIVVVRKADNTNIIKRVIALGGDRVKLDHGILKISYSKDSVKYDGTNDFVVVEESYVSDANKSENINYCNDDKGHYVNYGSFFLLGDNRNNSIDSRNYGNFPLSNLYGVVTEWSLNGKSFFTAVHKYFSFDLPACFGIDNRIKHPKT